MPNSFRSSRAWGPNQELETVAEDTGEKRLYSLSGNERNKLFLNRNGEQFEDVSLISGLDNIADGRTFVYWDYDRDGWIDIALVNANAPLLSFYRNAIGESAGCDNPGNIIALRYIGGNRSAASLPGSACLDGFGAKVEVDLGDLALKREHRCGEGFCGQNSATMIIGIGSHAHAQSVKVRWPSGRWATIERVPAGTLLTAYENREESADGSGFDVAPYHRSSPIGDHTIARNDLARPRLSLDVGATSQANSTVRIYTTMATWCMACRGHLPQIETLRSMFSEGELAIYGVPVDPTDISAKLRRYQAAFRPAYRLLKNLTEEERYDVRALLEKELGTEVLPSTIVTDANGQVLQALRGLPAVSDVRKWLGHQKQASGQSSGSS